MTHHCSRNCIAPPSVLLKVARDGSREEREAALRALALDSGFRQARAVHAARVALAPPMPRLVGVTGGSPQRTIYDQHESEATALGELVRSEGDNDGDDPAINEAYAYFGDTYKFFWEVLGRNSIDDQGMGLVGLVHFGHAYANAFWDGEGHMFFGDGDGKLFTRLTKSLDVIGHELTHGVTQYTAKLAYQDQAGALNESLSDVFGSLVTQFAKGQTADQASWLIGEEVVGPTLAPALRSLKDPGNANQYDDQPADMDHFVVTADDHGGVHTNSGIPNHAFYVVAITLGGHAWTEAGLLWYDAMRDPRMKPTADFRTFANATLRAAKQRFGAESAQVDAVRKGWEAVKLPV
jgi:Zn-dependent metalloprotease